MGSEQKPTKTTTNTFYRNDWLQNSKSNANKHSLHLPYFMSATNSVNTVIIERGKKTKPETKINITSL